MKKDAAVPEETKPPEAEPQDPKLKDFSAVGEAIFDEEGLGEEGSDLENWVM